MSVKKVNTVTNPETIAPVRRPDEGKQPLFARIALCGSAKSGEDQRATNESLVGEKKRTRYRSPDYDYRLRSCHRSTSTSRKRYHSPSPSHYRHRNESEKSENGNKELLIELGAEEGTIKYDVKELKRITVRIDRPFPPSPKQEVARKIIDPETIAPVRRPGRSNGEERDGHRERKRRSYDLSLNISVTNSR
ncbi:uncharacterized protein [Rhodnius prolixus]|uniref:uncharacterized protein n=1 Tax=Rhodnius prolixus TaxID=13249 RepID=UPI003D1886B3